MISKSLIAIAVSKAFSPDCELISNEGVGGGISDGFYCVGGGTTDERVSDI